MLLRRRISHPEVPRRHIAGAALQEQTFASKLTGYGRAQRRREICIPIRNVASHARAMAGEARKYGERATVDSDDAEYLNGVVHRILVPNAIDGNSGNPTGT